METAASEYVVALDVGTSRTRCLIAEVTAGLLRVVGRGEEASRGLRRGEVIDLAAAGYAASRAIQIAERHADVEVQTVFLAVGSRHVGFFNNRACVGITREERTITARDVQRALASAHRVPLREDAMPVGSLTCSFAVDDVRHVREPEGMHGARLEAEVHVITDARSTVENLAGCLDPAKLDIEEFVFAPYAAGEAVLDDDEKKLGVALIDIGAGTTGLLVYRDHAPVFSSVVPLGGDHLTNDIAIGMDFGLADATRLKEEHADVGASGIEHPFTFRRPLSGAAYSVDPRRLHAIVEPRVRELLDIVRRELGRAGVRPATIRAVLTGGTSRLPGIDALAGTVLGCPVRIGRPRRNDRAAFGSLGPDLAVAAGLLLVGLRAREHQASPDAAPNPAGRFLSWVRQLF